VNDLAAAAAQLQHKGRLDEAVALYWQAIEQTPDRAELHVALASALQALGRPEEALHCQRRAAALMSGDARAQAALADRLRHLGRYAEAFGFYRRAVELAPDDPEAGFGLAECLLGAGEIEAALVENERVLTLAPDHPGAHAQRVTALLRLGPAGRDRPGVWEVLLKVAKDAQDRKDWEHAIRARKALVARFPDAPAPPSQLATTLRLAGRIDEAESVVLKALAERPELLGCALEYAWAAAARRDWTEALRRWDETLARHPDSAHALGGRVHALAQTGRIDGAERDCLSAIARFPDEPILRACHAWLAARRRDWPAALERWHIVKRLQPGYPGIDHRIEEAQQAAKGAA